MLNSKLLQLKRHFGITVPADWQGVAPAWILQQDGIGEKTLDYIRLLLAVRGMTLKDDRTAEYWQQHLQHVKISDPLGNEEDFEADGEGVVIDRGVMFPATVLIDSAEQHPYTFQGFRTDAGQGERPWIVNTQFTSLGRFPNSLGDYSIDVGQGRCHVERKSIEDAHSTFLGWDGRRERFECELGNLSRIEAGLVVVECTLPDLVLKAPTYGKRSAQQNAKTLHRSVIAWMQDYQVRWIFCDGKRQAEQVVFRWFERYCRKLKEERKEVEREARREVKIEKELAAI